MFNAPDRSAQDSYKFDLLLRLSRWSFAVGLSLLPHLLFVYAHIFALPSQRVRLFSCAILGKYVVFVVSFRSILIIVILGKYVKHFFIIFFKNFARIGKLSVNCQCFQRLQGLYYYCRIVSIYSEDRANLPPVYTDRASSRSRSVATTIIKSIDQDDRPWDERDQDDQQRRSKRTGTTQDCITTH